MSDKMRLVSLLSEPWEDVYPGVQRRIVGGERMTLSTYRFAPGGRFPKHHHPQEQMVLVREGSITFTSPQQSLTVEAEQVLVILPDVPHEATAGSRGAVVVSVVAPARQSSADYTMEE